MKRGIISKEVAKEEAGTLLSVTKFHGYWKISAFCEYKIKQYPLVLSQTVHFGHSVVLSLFAKKVSLALQLHFKGVGAGQGFIVLYELINSNQPNKQSLTTPSTFPPS